MSTYIPTQGPMPGEQWTPSNSDVGYSFLSQECGNCQRDKAMRDGAPLEECDDNDVCPIIAASFLGEAVEWRRMPDGEIKCIAFVEKGQPIPAPRCDRTADLFDGAQGGAA
jgi:hypothetical protein